MKFGIVQYQTPSNVWLSLIFALIVLVLPCTFAHAQSLPADVAERKLAWFLEKIEDSSGPVKKTVSTHLLTADWPVDLLPTVVEALSTALEHPGTVLEAAAVRIFAERNGEGAAFMLPYIANSLPKSNRKDTVELLLAVRAIGSRANFLKEIIRSRVQDSDAVVAIHAASALVRIEPTSRYARGKLLGYLLSERPEHRWRAADAMAHAPVMNERWIAELSNLVKDKDVRVRVTSAYALWRITDDAKISRPALLASLSEADTSLATAFVFPSFQGDSHRVYALKAVVEMGPIGDSAIPQVISVVQEVARAETPISEPYAILGLAALRAIRELGTVTEAEFKKIEKSVACDACAFTLVQDQAKIALASIRKRENQGDPQAQR